MQVVLRARIRQGGATGKDAGGVEGIALEAAGGLGLLGPCVGYKDRAMTHRCSASLGPVLIHRILIGECPLHDPEESRNAGE